MHSPDQRKPVTILGAGIVGICTALSLLERGVPVTVIDQGEPGQETSMGNAGVVSPWSIIPQSLPGTWKTIPKLMFGYGRPLSIDPRMVWRMLPWGLRFLQQGQPDKLLASAEAMSHLCGPSIELYQKHLKGTGHGSLLVDSMYIHAFREASGANLDAIDYRIRSEMGADLELVDRGSLSDIEPALSSDFEAAILIKGQARVLSPGRLGTVLADKARAMGATFKRASVKQIRKSEHSWQIDCEGETLSAEQVVICLGVWSRAILESLGLRVPLMAERGYHVEFTEPGVEVNNSIMDVDAKVVASSMADGLRVAGQAEFAPIDAPPTRRREAQLVEIASTLFPSMEVRQTRFWMGRRPSFPDSLPVLGPVTGHQGLFANFGHSHYGLMMAPSSGEKLAGAICDEPQNISLKAFSVDRFGM